MGVKAVAISPEVRDLLERSTIDDQVLRLPAGKLDRPLYEAVDKALRDGTFKGAGTGVRAGLLRLRREF